MQNIMIHLQFDGSGFHGFQRQINALTIEEVLLGAIKKITGESPVLTGCSRTDSGVHALDYVCNFRSNTKVPMDKLPFALNTKLPSSIRVFSAQAVKEDFHARFSAKSKTYIYKASTAKILSPFLPDYVYHFPYEINIESIKKAVGFFVGMHDFSAFMSAGGSQKTTVREVYHLTAEMADNNIIFEITANAYLYNMVRIIAGTLLQVGSGKIAAEDIPSIIAGGKRKNAGITAGAEGLYLKEIIY